MTRGIEIPIPNRYLKDSTGKKIGLAAFFEQTEANSTKETTP